MRAPQTTLNHTLARLLPHCDTCAQRIGKLGGGGLLVQLVLTSPPLVSWKSTVPASDTALVELLRPAVVQASVNVPPLVFLTVTFSFVGVGLYALSLHVYVHVSPFACGSQSSASAAGARRRAAAK